MCGKETFFPATCFNCQSFPPSPSEETFRLSNLIKSDVVGKRRALGSEKYYHGYINIDSTEKKKRWELKKGAQKTKAGDVEKCKHIKKLK
jgi:hypothetical protein